LGRFEMSEGSLRERKMATALEPITDCLLLGRVTGYQPLGDSAALNASGRIVETVFAIEVSDVPPTKSVVGASQTTSGV
jgi:hypothetical protein